MNLRSLFLTCALATVSLTGWAATDNWPQFRGPNGDGHSDAKGVPRKWSDTENIKWKTPVQGRGWGSPVIWGKQVWVPTASEDGKQLYAVCMDKDSGKVLFNEKLFDVAAPQFAHKFNSYASPTPVIEEGRVYITFGSPGTACLDTKTFKVLWQRTDIECNHYRGAGSSPIIYKDLLIMHYDGSDHQFVLALDKKTGKTVWNVKRSIDFMDLKDGKPEAEGDWRKAYATPHVAMIKGKPVLLSIGAKAFYGYDPLTGKELWRVEERGQHSASTRPVVGKDMIFYPTGFAKGQLFAMKADASGVLRATNMVWTTKRSVPNKPSLLLIDDLLFAIDDSGIASCLDAKTGEAIWNERIGGNFSASPVYVDGMILFTSEQGKCTLIEAGKTYKVIAENQLGDGFMASPAVSGKAFFLRDRKHVYRIEDSGLAAK
jgi:outer membrane protein assembly factor BamB